LKWKVGGECSKCGICCRKIQLALDGKWIKTEKQFKAILKRNPQYSMFSIVESVKGKALYFGCKHVQADGLCSIHADRPALCRNYPEPEIPEFGGSLPKECTYTLTPDTLFETLIANAQFKLDHTEESS
jgi:uncharacterized protein